MTDRASPTGESHKFIGETQARETEEIFKLLVSAVEDYAIFALDPTGRILTWNAGAERLKGYKAQEIIGSHFSRFYIPEDLARNHPAQELAIATREGKYEEEGWRVRKDGTRFWANVVITALKDRHGNLKGFAKVTRDLTERKQNEQSLRQSNEELESRVEQRTSALQLQMERFQRVAAATSLGIWYCDLPFSVLNWDEKVKEHFWLPAEAQVTIGIFYDRIHPDDRDRTKRAIDRSIASRGPYDIVYRTTNPANEDQVKWIRAIGWTDYHPVTGEPIRFDGITLDETQTKLADLKLLQLNTERDELNQLLSLERSQLRNILDHIPSGLLIIDGKTSDIVVTNSRAEDIWGMPIPPGLDRYKFSAYHVDSGKRFEGEDWPSLQALKTRRPAPSREAKIQKGDGTTAYIQMGAAPTLNQLGEVVSVIVTLEDITAQKRAELALRESEQRYRTLAESVPQLVWTSLPDGRCDYLSKQWVDFTGVPELGQMGFGWLDLVIHPDDRQRALEHWMGAVDGIHPYDLEYRIRRHDGTYRWFKARGTPVRNAADEITYWFGTCTDIEDQKRSLETLATINRIGQTISAELDQTRLVQFVTDSATQLVQAQFGAFFYKVTDEKDETYMLYAISGVPKNAFSAFPMPRNTKLFEPTFIGKSVVRSDDITKDSRYGKSAPHFGMPKGHLPVVSYLAVPVISRSGEVLGGLFFGHAKPGMFQDREEELMKGLASQAAIAIDNARLFQRSKEATRLRDEFLSIASHELKTPLTSIKLQTQIFNRLFQKNPDEATRRERLLRFVGSVERGLDQLIRLVEEMLDISRIQNKKLNFNLEMFDLATVIEDIFERLQPELSNASIEARFSLQPNVLAPIDRFRVEQVLTNLATNAIRYAPNAPLEIELNQEGEFAVLRFHDHGPGISPENQKRVFQRFERLGVSSVSSGLGLGLYICKEIVTGHGGTIEIEENTKTGTCFVIRLPLTQPLPLPAN